MADDIRSYSTLGPRGTPADMAKAWIDDKTYGGLGKIYRGALQVASSGFGKGVLIGLAVAAVSAIGLGIAFTTGGLGLTAPTLGVGIEWGINAVSSFLLSWPGIISLGAAGTLGAVAQTLSERDKITADVAQAQAQMYKVERAIAASQQQEQSLSQDPLVDHCSHCAQLALRREQEQQQQQSGRGV